MGVGHVCVVWCGGPMAMALILMEERVNEREAQRVERV